MTAFAIYLFVEGDADQVVLEELVGDELRKIGVCVVPVRVETGNRWHRSEPHRRGYNRSIGRVARQCLESRLGHTLNKDRVRP